MKNSLIRNSDRTEIAQRIAALTPSSSPGWGSMSVGGMVCHLNDAYRVGLGEKIVKPVNMPLPGAAIKFIALRLPVTWPRNIKAPEEVRQGGGGTPPGDFTDDKSRLLEALERFCDFRQFAQIKHPIFGFMRSEDWMRWGYLHADHHLRQFGG